MSRLTTFWHSFAQPRRQFSDVKAPARFIKGSPRLKPLPRSYLFNGPEKRPPKVRKFAKDKEAKELEALSISKVLASPIRQCVFSLARVPGDLLIPFTLIPNPEKPNEEWILPDFARSGSSQRRYLMNSGTALDYFGQKMYKRLSFSSSRKEVVSHAYDGCTLGRRKVWRPDMKEYVAEHMKRYRPEMTLKD